jgi:hypothetical protein
MGEVNHQNYSTRLEVEELVVGANNSLVYKDKDTVMINNKTKKPLPG